MRELLRRIRFLFHRAEYERNLEEEMAHHLSMIAHDTRSEAAARKRFGNLTSWKEESRGMWTFRFLEQAAQDIRYAMRAMAANPVFTATAALSLALGIGANTAIYSFMDAILLRSLPVQRPAELAILEWHSSKRPPVVQGINGTARRYGDRGTMSPNFPYGAYEALRGDTRVFSSLFAYTYVQSFNAVVRNEAEAVGGGFVSGNYFAGLDVPPSAGRLIEWDDDRKGAPPVVVLTYPYWQRRYNADPDVLGKPILLNHQSFTIVGVTAPGFFGVDPQQSPMLFLPIHSMPLFAIDPAAEERSRFFNDHSYWIEMMGRLRPGVSFDQAQAAMRAQFTAFAASTAASPKDAVVLPELALDAGGAGIDSLRRAYSKPLYVLMTMVGLILAIACANLANLLLARGTARRREMAVRLSLGAGRWRIVRQMLTESALLSVAGGVLGLAVAFAGIRLITWLIANGRENFSLHAELNWPVIGFTLGLSLLAGAIFGLAPAIQATRIDFTPALKESRTQGVDTGRRAWRMPLGHVLVVVQIAVSMLLVVGAGLFVRTLVNLHSIDVGFNRENLLLLSLNGQQAGYKGAALARFYADLMEKFREIPGVRSASGSTYPLVSRFANFESVTIPGLPLPGDPGANVMEVEPDFLGTMQIPVVLGRDLQPGDQASPAVAVVNQKFASVFFGDRNPVGQQIAFDNKNPDAPLFEIVGVAKSAHYNSLQERESVVVYVPYTRRVAQLGRLFFELRTAGNPLSVVSAVRRIVHDASRDISIAELGTQSQRIEQTISQERTFASLGTCFAVLALLIACVGLYGAMAFMVARRTGEIGVRMALGAQRPKILWMVLRQVLGLTAVGLSLGYLAARFAARLVESFLYGMQANDPLAAAIAVAILTSAALMAGYAPAWRASRIDPAAALRNE
ncbi:MAG TPA: ABC transporter permease [Bryobacteraceae bacterium]|nr:ABC transporter permease [Bryobacteraceae bacterium]